jgi:hypothetical protein
MHARLQAEDCAFRGPVDGILDRLPGRDLDRKAGA